MGNSEDSFFTDQLGRQVQIKGIPQKIISLVPSQTEYLSDIGLNKEIVGITKFCVHPEEIFRSKTRVGGTKNIDFDKIKQLDPDLIICNKEENQKEQIEALMQLYPVWVSDIKTLEDAFEMMEITGKITGKETQALKLINEIKEQFLLLSPLNSIPLKVAYFIWKKPYMVAASDNFIDHLIEKCGLTNVFKDHPLRYPTISSLELNDYQPDLIFLSSEPYPFKENHIQEFKQLYPFADVKIVDGEMFSWYGSRLRLSPAYINDLLKQL
ncbi:MAG: helical backbone metal receptor [Bacteroidota bacterium]|nr:helical backbone metal receptor [Bacteroidota bacterium]